MGQYWRVFNLDKKEFIDPHQLGCGLKLWEQLANHPGTGAALIVLCANMPESRGGGDFDLEENWHGAERTFPKHNNIPAKMPKNYKKIAKATIGRWAGDRIALIGDYAEDNDLEGVNTKEIYNSKEYTDISDYVCKVIEHELRGTYVGDGWKRFDKDNTEEK